MTEDEKPKRIRRSPVQIRRDEEALAKIGEVVSRVNRWDAKVLREALDLIGDALVEAGRL